ncbi:aspartate kinase [Aquibacillus koreensis]|uniref:Aspartokinase n=1 Tax=Aquibacillus koreensis TaxID=279446 RepID=A0A9X3WN61_9BACI|nr:aspartate kinase [Aquibacillus koreensis]MCT2534578.1 aspartate kinase [Aquibacillus koreensis]MDC3421828.1 aspartate kinase [Aquibacillus koreensis]
MKILVQKFGGTSVRDQETRQSAIEHINDAIREGYKVVVVVSAMGRHPDPYATDSLLELVGFPHSNISKREQDLLLSCGETISSVVFSNELKANQISSVALTGAQAGFLTSDDFTEAKIKAMHVERVIEELQQSDVVVVAGFQGRTENGDITTIGRGGSDTSAAALGAALDADYIDIFTDVEGIMTADPRVVKSARTLNVVTYTEICNLAYQGAKVIHPRAVEIAMQAKVPIRVRSTKSKDTGTLVTTSRDTIKGKDIPDRLVTGIAHMSGITQIKVHADHEPYQLHSKVFKAMAEAGISVDFINISPSGVIYTIPKNFTDEALKLLEALSYQPEIIEDCAKVSLVGAGMTGVPGVTAKIVQTLTDAGVQILQSADSHTTIWVLIRHRDLIAAVNALHETFELYNQSS